MDTIKNYVETMFINLPETPEIIQLKEDILGNMEDKYTELIEAGKSNNEAIGIVISEFGNIDEILEEMNIHATVDEADTLPVVSEVQAIEYMEAKKNGGFGIGAGVFSCIFGVCLLLAIMVFTRESDVGVFIGVAVMGIFVTIGVILFIWNGMKLAPYNYLERNFVLLGGVRKLIEEEKRNYEKSYRLSLVIGVACCVLSIVPLMISLIIGGGGDAATLLGTSLMMIMIGTGVFFFIYAGNIVDAQNKLLKNGIAVPISKSEKQKYRLKKKIEGVYWPIVVILYFVLSFGFAGWSYTWIIWPIAGVLYSAIQSLLELPK